MVAESTRLALSAISRDAFLALVRTPRRLRTLSAR